MTRRRSGPRRRCCATRPCRAPRRRVGWESRSPRRAHGSRATPRTRFPGNGTGASPLDTARWVRGLPGGRARPEAELFLRARLQVALPRPEAIRGISGGRQIAAVDAGFLRTWRESWTWAATTHQTNLKLLKAFFRFAAEQGWLEESPAASLRPPRVDPPPTMPLSRAEVLALVRAASDHPRGQALLLLMRYSGLAIRDAATLPRDAVDGNQLTLRRAKTGEFVLCELPQPVVEALERIARPDWAHFFWTGTSRPQTVTNYWRARLKEIADKALFPGFKPHRLRNTFAVQLLLRCVAMQDVSTLLGHSSIQTTEHYYAPWNRSRRDRLAAIVRDADEGDELLREVAARSLQTGAGGCSTQPPQTARPSHSKSSEYRARMDSIAHHVVPTMQTQHLTRLVEFGSTGLSVPGTVLQRTLKSVREPGVDDDALLFEHQTPTGQFPYRSGCI